MRLTTSPDPILELLAQLTDFFDAFALDDPHCSGLLGEPLDLCTELLDLLTGFQKLTQGLVRDDDLGLR